MHCEWVAQTFPEAKLYGSERHIGKFPHLRWEKEFANQEAMFNKFSDDLQFSVPCGVDYISPNEAVHFSSTLAFHTESGTVHSNDTVRNAEQ